MREWTLLFSAMSVTICDVTILGVCGIVYIYGIRTYYGLNSIYTGQLPTLCSFARALWTVWCNVIGFSFLRYCGHDSSGYLPSFISFHSEGQ